MKYTAIITARGGSKRLPGKNSMHLAGRPLIEWTIRAALAVDRIERVIVSTDDEQLASISREAGAVCPFIRPSHLATDVASSFDVVEHTLNYLKNERTVVPDQFILLQPTSPLRDSVSINEAIDLFENKQADNVVSVCRMDHSPLWSNILPPDLSMDHFIRDEVKNKRSQDLPDYYRLNGAIYICNTKRFLIEKSFLFPSHSYAYVMSTENSVDIDTEIDFLLAEAILKKRGV